MLYLEFIIVNNNYAGRLSQGKTLEKEARSKDYDGTWHRVDQWDNLNNSCEDEAENRH